MNIKKLFILTLIITLTVTTFMGIITFVSGELGELQVKIIVTSLLFGYHSILLLVAANLYDKLKNKFSYVSGSLAVIGFIYIMLSLWEVIDVTNEHVWMFKLLLTLIMMPLGTTVTSILLTLKTDARLANIVKSITIVLIYTVATMVLFSIWELLPEHVFDQPIYIKSVVVYLMLGILGVVLTPLLIKYSKVK